MTAPSDFIDLASERLGGSVLYATDDFFAEKENLLKPGPPVWKEHEYTDRGKWMDGWESRRKRTPGHDWAIIRLGLPGMIREVIADTSYFRGNYPEHCSIEATYARPETLLDALLSEETEWVEILPKSKLAGDSQNRFTIDSSQAFTHLRFHIYPDGGVARLRVLGEVVPDWSRLGNLGSEIDLAAVENGARVLSCSDMFFGPKHNLIMPGRAANMSEGWETKRRRGPGHDWVIVELAAEGEVRGVEIDTAHFKGNYPDTASIDGASGAGDPATMEWVELLPRTRLQAHTRHLFSDELRHCGPFTHLRLNVYPDGGVSRLRVRGVVTEAGRQREAVRRINTNPLIERELRRVCGSSEWSRRMAESRPFESWGSLTAQSDAIWSALPREQWLAAFSAHPRIGEKAGGAWSSSEQSGIRSASAATMEALAQANRDYEKKYGHIFIVCATGKSAEEMLVIVRERMKNDSDTELRTAAEEQRKIMHLRLAKLVTG
ncbi:MAG TPA: allantoicase [Thermoanaerobaculia bacterium]|nr:allantoicase [Thermoanaerobaculia bacterium]